MKKFFTSLWFPYVMVFFLLGSVGAYIFTAPEPLPSEGVELEVEPPLEMPPVSMEEALELDPNP